MTEQSREPNHALPIMDAARKAALDAIRKSRPKAPQSDPPPAAVSASSQTQGLVAAVPAEHVFEPSPVGPTERLLEQQERDHNPASVLHPEDNPVGWDGTVHPLTKVAPNRAPYGTREELETYVNDGRQNGGMLDDLIYQWRLSGLGPFEIARKLGPSVTPEYVQGVIGRILSQRQQLTASEYRWLQLARLDTVINALWGGLQRGDIGHAQVILAAIERANKMMELEKETTRIEIELISDGQAELMKQTLRLVLEAVAGVPQIRDLIRSQPEVQEIIDGTVSASLEEAAAVIDAPENRVLELERKPRSA